MATYIKVGGAWRTVSGDTEAACGYVKVGGEWKTVTNSYVKVSGTWRAVCAPIPTPTPTPTPTPGGGGPADPPQDSSVSSLSPQSGAAAGGYTVTLNGSFPSNLTNISINGTNIGSYSRVSDTAYNFTMPAGTAGTTVQVQAFNGRTPLMSSLTFTYNSEGGETNTCVNGNYCSSIVYEDGTAVSVNATNGTFNGSLQTESCGNGGTRTKAYTCVTPTYCPNISVGAGQCIGGGTNTCTMPPVVGLTELTAAQAINAAGLLYEYTDYLNNSQGATAANNGTVAGQSPAANTPTACNTNTTLTVYQYSQPSQFTYCPSLGYAVASSGYPGNCPGAQTCSCTPLTSTPSTQSVSTSQCPSGSQNTTINTYNQCCVTNGTVPQTTVTVAGACEPEPFTCSGANCSQSACQTCAPTGTAGPNSYPSTRSVATSVCPSGTMNTFVCWTPGSCANIITDTGCAPSTQNCTPVYSYREYRSSCGQTVDIYVNPCTGAESFTCPTPTPTPSPSPTPEPTPTPTPNCSGYVYRYGEFFCDGYASIYDTCGNFLGCND